MLIFRAVHHVGQCSSEDLNAFVLPQLRQQGLSGVVIKVTWFLIFPFFAVWTLIGTWWSLAILEATPTCLPEGTHSWFIVFWQILCYVWTALYSVFVCLAFRYERSINSMEKDHRSLAATEDALRRWGQVPFLPDVDNCLQSRGLCQDEIRSLPRLRFDSRVGSCHQRLECSICLMDFQPREVCRELPGCAHVFHQSCIDLWLLRRGDCPLCKNRIQACTA